MTNFHHFYFQKGANETLAVFCEFENNKGDFVKIFLKNVTDPVGEFWEKKTLQMSSGVS